MTMSAQKTDYPVFGAQIFIEPGQTCEQIDHWFSVMEDCGMTVGRIRLFGTHIQQGDGWDFSLYDQAFDAARKHGVRLFVTLFPPTDELTDLGGFKFPESTRHLEEIDRYTRACVTHYKDHPAMYAWVLQNEPGLEDAVSVPDNDLTRKVYSEWVRTQPGLDRQGNEFLKGDFRGEDFLRYFTAWYLDHIAATVASIDPLHGRHVNPHQIMKNLPQYDFAAYSRFLTSLGASLHLSWHFGLFNQDEYTTGVSLMTDIVRSSAHHNPFWVTELQGGTVIWSGRAPYCPTAEHTSQYLWTCVGAGAEGVVFWTLNPRKAVMEAGEWGMVDYTGQPSDRLLAARDVAACVRNNADLFGSARPSEPRVSILFNNESLQMQKRESDTWGGREPGRFETGVMVSVIAAYQAVMAHGVAAQVRDMRNFDWSDTAQTVILPDMICLPDDMVGSVRSFVESGGRLVVTGRSCYFDSRMRCLFMGEHPLSDCFGARLKEFKAEGNIWRGSFELTTGTEFRCKPLGATAVRNSFGRGEVIWVPTTIDLGSYHSDIMPLAGFYGEVCRSAVDAAPFSLRKPVAGVVVRTMDCDGGHICVLVNKTGGRVVLRPSVRLSRAGVIFGRSRAVKLSRRVVLRPEETIVIRYQQ